MKVVSAVTDGHILTPSLSYILLYDACANPYVIRGYKEISIISNVDMMIKVVIALENGNPGEPFSRAITIT